MAGMYSVEQFQRLNKPEFIVLTWHSRKLFAGHGISIVDIGYVFRAGEIIEQYPDDTPLPSCLIPGYSGERALHGMAGIDEPWAGMYGGRRDYPA